MLNTIHVADSFFGKMVKSSLQSLCDNSSIFRPMTPHGAGTQQRL
jgi:hypothetical protein